MQASIVGFEHGFAYEYIKGRQLSVLGHAYKLVFALVYPLLLGGFVATSAVFAQAIGTAQVNNDVSFSAAEIGLIGVIAAPIIAAITLLFKSLLAAKDESIKILQIETAALSIRVADGLNRETGLQGQLAAAFSGDLRENRDVMQELVGEVKSLNNDQERRHSDFVKLMTTGDRRAIVSGTREIHTVVYEEEEESHRLHGEGR